jgi:3',5'-nucleoside bisphosphate phosphatase
MDMNIEVRGHTSAGSMSLGPEECPLLTLKQRGHTSAGSMSLRPEECPLLTLKQRGHTSAGSMSLGPEECPLLTLKKRGHTSLPEGLKSEGCPRNNSDSVECSGDYLEECVRHYQEGCSPLTLEQDSLYIDLHTHSTASDGSMTPTELVRHAYDKGLAAVAITDHDTVNGVAQAMEEGMRIGIEVIPGVEISVDFSPEMHLLGYFPDGQVHSILKTLEELREKREQRNPRIVNKLNELGFELTLSEARRLAIGGNVGRPHIARVMVDKGYVESIAEAFDKYLASGRPAYFKKDKLTPADGIAEIVRAGGVPVLAHPIYLGMTGEHLDLLLGELAGFGLMGIEAYYTENTPEQTTELLQLAMKHKLLVTGGSDFHGRFKPDIEIGSGKGSLKVPYSLLSALKQTHSAPGLNHEAK